MVQTRLCEKHCSSSALCLPKGGSAVARMETEAVKAIRERDAALRQEQANIRKEIRNAGKRKRREHSSTGLSGMLAGGGRCGKRRRLQQVSLCLLLFVLAEFDFDVVLAYATGQGRASRFLLPAAQRESQEFRERIIQGVRDSFDEVPFEHVHNMFTDAAYYGSIDRLLAAARYVAEFRLFWWLVKQNCEKGIAPKNWQLQKAISGFIPVRAPSAIRDKLITLATAGSKSADKWMARFRCAWGASHGKLEAGCNVTVQEMRDKVPIMDLGIFFRCGSWSICFLQLLLRGV